MIHKLTGANDMKIEMADIVVISHASEEPSEFMQLAEAAFIAAGYSSEEFQDTVRSYLNDYTDEENIDSEEADSLYEENCELKTEIENLEKRIAELEDTNKMLEELNDTLEEELEQTA
jgi:uncharacterized protein YlxW (UPF0749 family)